MSSISPQISVLMPVYNAERFVAEAVQSILSQTFGDFEFIIIDDGSSDGSLEILRRFERADSRIRLSSRPNTGYTVALNEMLAMASGQFVARMDADDVAMPQRLQKQVDYLCAHPNCVVVGCCSCHRPKPIENFENETVVGFFLTSFLVQMFGQIIGIVNTHLVDFKTIFR